MNKKLIGYYLIISIITIFSFRFLSSLYYPAYNSDNAITVLMIHYFSIPNDLYFWSQNRLGSIIPLMAQVPYYFGVSALVSESVIHYMILFLGFLAFSSFFSSYRYRIVFAVAWFFPPMHMIDITQFCFGIHYSLLAISCALINYMINHKHQDLKYYLVLMLTIICLILMIWVNDMALVSLGVLIFMMIFLIIKKQISLNIITFLISVAGIIAGYFFLFYAKTTSGTTENYSVLASFSEMKFILNKFSDTMIDLLTFQAREPVTGIYLWMIIILFAVLIAYIIKKKLKSTPGQKYWMYFFLAEAVIMFTMIMISHWTADKNVPRRYFTTVYISIFAGLLIFLEGLNLKENQKKYLFISLMMIVLTGTAGTIYNLKFIWPRTLKPVADWAAEFKGYGKIGIIGDYWTSYVNASADPANIVAVPFDGTNASKNYAMKMAVLNSERILVIRDGWMDNYPDTLTQYGRTLIRKGEEYRCANCFVCEYSPEYFTQNTQK